MTRGGLFVGGRRWEKDRDPSAEESAAFERCQAELTEVSQRQSAAYSAQLVAWLESKLIAAGVRR